VEPSHGQAAWLTLAGWNAPCGPPSPAWPSNRHAASRLQATYMQLAMQGRHSRRLTG
jgi:hypothetical protein